jgi:hypothetical protein
MKVCIIICCMMKKNNVFGVLLVIHHTCKNYSISNQSHFPCFYNWIRCASIINDSQEFSFQQHVSKQFTSTDTLLSLLLFWYRRVYFVLFICGFIKSFRDPWLFISSYCISFIPPTLIFIIFASTSMIYKEDVYLSIDHLRQYIDCRKRLSINRPSPTIY